LGVAAASAGSPEVPSVEAGAASAVRVGCPSRCACSAGDTSGTVVAPVSAIGSAFRPGGSMNAVYWRVSRALQPTLSCTDTMGSSMRCTLRSRTPVGRPPSPSICQCRPEADSGLSPALTSARTQSGVRLSPGLS